jgi:hypothetical protein
LLKFDIIPLKEAHEREHLNVVKFNHNRRNRNNAITNIEKHELN